MCKPDAPDPYATAAAQGKVNAEAIKQAAQYNQVNQVTPFGSQSWSGELGSPDRTVTTTLNPQTQNLINSQMGISQGLTDAAQSRLGQITNQPFSLGGIPGATPGQLTSNLGDAGQLSADFGAANIPGLQTSIASGPLQKNIADAGQIQRQLGPAGQIQTSVGGADAATRNSVEDALYQRATSRLDPQFQQDQSALETRLANQGITMGSDAYNTEMANFARNKNDAYASARNDAVYAGGAEQSRLFGLGLDAGNFANNAQNQGFNQNLGAGQFANAAQAQQYGQNANNMEAFNRAQAQEFGQNAANAQFNNAAAAQSYAQNMAARQFQNDVSNQQFDRNVGTAQFQNDVTNQQYQNDQAQRNQGINELILERNQPFNELASFLQGAPAATQPNFGQPAQYSPIGNDITGSINSNYAARAGANASTTGALFGLGGTLGAAAILCWVAREVMPERWLEMRKWMLTKAPRSLFDFYVNNGEEIAEFIHDNPEYKKPMREKMEALLV